jgi:hypothetical protein
MVLGTAHAPPLPHVAGYVREYLDGEVARDSATHGVEGSLGDELEEGERGRHRRLSLGMKVFFSQR